MKITAKFTSFALALGLAGGAGVVLAPAAHADATNYTITRSTLAACQAEYRTAVKQLAGQIGAQYPCEWNTYQRAYIGMIVYNY
ncbi:hypothetical protein [Leucobacter tardus]|uniref:Uncharacterized protein n=1 Tax=Leucobacter tardus TaxID=501483 RepID=A0A939QJ06_9MICO|nr:hypothetical protein [Leucobacter tardus]MBO2988791.1 hypothetical protein [Leucobacter tardus]